MKKHLSELTMSQYIDLVCGDTSVLSRFLDVIPKDAARIRRDIIMEYQQISDPAEMKKHLLDGTKLAKAKATEKVMSICAALIEGECFDDVRDILTVMGIRHSKWDDGRLTAEISSRLARARKNIKELIEETESKEIDERKIRESYDAQTATLMSHFRFQIDITTMKATHYAHLVQQCKAEIKAQTQAYRSIKY